jgi:hypothetical protein
MVSGRCWLADLGACGWLALGGFGVMFVSMRGACCVRRVGVPGRGLGGTGWVLRWRGRGSLVQRWAGGQERQ